MIQEKLAGLSSAEQFFETLGVPFEQQVVNVSRLHILKRFRELMRDLAPEAGEAECAAALAAAYAEFAEGRGAKTFKVFKDAMPAFVPLTDLRATSH
ncbi:nitrogenase [Paramagnetospirillum kuznetsovii]|uniref:Nitrogenase-stabilizing/protective protein NifW n=1 Tax=Paramagnetospirillum kuznetsovii TaxID=2053833 RepID=A0A364NZ99_9PROT|nr:nitrogenase-stabilizing/protective protein NifW [Paramagnetospirillum kuznetsovii]RAU22363.1 nitrogenase [Paramagnetospirillum kuznetsovii]